MGAVVTLELPDDSPVLSLPWIITFGPLEDDEEWEPVVCGPYERPHAVSLAETVVAEEDLMAVVEPLLPHASVDEIRSEIATARLAAESDEDEDGDDTGDDTGDDLAVAIDEEYDDDEAFDVDFEDEEAEYDEGVEPSPPPSPEEVRAGFARIAARLTAPS